MRINIKTPDIMIFDKLNHGDVFEYNGYYFMKFPEVRGVLIDDICNAVRLENGWLVHFGGAETVRYIDAELTTPTQKGNKSNA